VWLSTASVDDVVDEAVGTVTVGHHLGRLAQVDVPDVLQIAVVELDLEVEPAIALGPPRLDSDLIARRHDVVTEQVITAEAGPVDVAGTDGDDRAIAVVDHIEPALVGGGLERGQDGEDGGEAEGGKLHHDNPRLLALWP
jgi:hypothetical protein